MGDFIADLHNNESRCHREFGIPEQYSLGNLISLRDVLNPRTVYTRKFGIPENLVSQSRIF